MTKSGTLLPVSEARPVYHLTVCHRYAMNRLFPEIRKHELSHEWLSLLLQNGMLGLRIPRFLDQPRLDHILSRIRSPELKQSHRLAGEFKKPGPVFTEVSCPETREQYHQDAIGGIDFLRGLLAPQLSPIDELRLMLEERWGWGAQLMQDGPRKFFVGTCRYLENNVDLRPHIDQISRNLRQDSPLKLTSQLAAICYLAVPKQGGELEIWNRFPEHDEYQALKGEAVYGIEREALPAPDLVYRPRPGDLLLLNSQAIHAVRPSHDEDRITMGAWVGYQGPGTPLLYWS